MRASGSERCGGTRHSGDNTTETAKVMVVGEGGLPAGSSGEDGRRDWDGGGREEEERR